MELVKFNFMKVVCYAAMLGLAVFEILNVYFIMPMPGGSQEINSLDIAYFLYQWRWLFRGILMALILAGIKTAWRSSRWIPVICILVLIVLSYLVNFKMAADTMFYQPKLLELKANPGNVVGEDKLIIGIAHHGEAKAYPIQYIGYHHQVRDSIGGKPVMVTYCTVCRTGRVFEPIIDGKPAEFRLVGMDHYNAMFEDKKTGSWWRQATGEAVAGTLKGKRLPEFPSTQITLSKWMEIYPNSLVMQPDTFYQEKYDSMSTYERGKPTGRLTKRDSASWHDKSWIIGIESGLFSKAIDWNRLQKERLIHDEVAGRPILIALSKDSASFIVLEKAFKSQTFTLHNDTLVSNLGRYTFFGKSLDSSQANLKRLKAYQEYWHSWRTFHPASAR
jgi:hypothetical protein